MTDGVAMTTTLRMWKAQKVAPIDDEYFRVAPTTRRHSLRLDSWSLLALVVVVDVNSIGC